MALRMGRAQCTTGFDTDRARCSVFKDRESLAKRTAPRLNFPAKMAASQYSAARLAMQGGQAGFTRD
jgi:hypothetical protein